MEPQAPNNLPAQPNELLGRDQELMVAREHLLSHHERLLSLTGPPGVGKTRLGIAVAESVLDIFSQGVWFIDLAPLRDAELVGSEIARIFGITEAHADTALTTLITYLQNRQVLLVLDNFENVLPAAAWISKLLESTTELKILTTSRERLHLRWERVIQVAPLPLPNPNVAPTPSYLAGFPAITLFVQRAAAVNPAIALSVESAPIISKLCHRLDGLPLAIELAASRASVLSPAEILANLDDRFRLLGFGSLDLPERHQTLKAAIDWSYESLSQPTRQFLRRLSVFAGSFSLKAAELVGECNSLHIDGFTSLIELVEKSLVIRASGPAGEIRFKLIESIRVYLLDRLTSSRELTETLQRHASYVLGLVEQFYVERNQANQKARFDRIESDHDNVRAALQWSLDTKDYFLGKQIAAATWNFWWLRGHMREGIRWLSLFLEHSNGYRDVIQLSILEGAGTLQGWQRDYETGRTLLMEALQIARELDDRSAMTRILGRLSWIFWVNGKTEEAEWVAGQMKACPEGADPWELAHALLSLGNLLNDAGLLKAADKTLTQSLEYFQQAEERSGAVFAKSRLALLKFHGGDSQEAVEEMLGALGAAGQLQEGHVVVIHCVDDAIRLAALQNAPSMMAPSSLESMARILGGVDQWMETFGLQRSPLDHSAYFEMCDQIKQRLGDSSYSQLRQEGESYPVEEMIQQARALLRMTYPVASKSERNSHQGGASIMLSAREAQVIELVAEGLTNQEIGRRLFISERTVRFHMTSIFNKLGVENRAQAVAVANWLGIL